MKNFNTVAKSFKSMKIVKMIDNGVSKLAKLLHLKSKLVYIILGLLVAILLAMGLGKKKEGFDSASDAERPLASTVDNMNSSINYIVGWTTPADKQAFIDSINSWWKVKMLYLIVQGGVDLQTYDINKNNKIYQLKPEMVGEKDSLGNGLARYIDDNMTTPPTPEFLNKYTLITLNDPTNRYITQAELDTLHTQIDTKIKSFAGIDPTGMARLQTAYTVMIAYANQLGAYTLQNPRIKVTSLFYNNILGQGSRSNGAAWGRRTGGRWDLYSGYEPGGELDSSYGRGSGGYMRPGGGGGLSGWGGGQCGDSNMTNIPIECINSIYEKARCSAANLPFNRPGTIPVEGFPYSMFLSDTSLDISELPYMNWASFKTNILPKVIQKMCGGEETIGSGDQCSNGNMTNIPIQCINSIYEKAQCSAADLPFNRPSTIPVEGFPYNMVLSDSSLDISQIPDMNWASFQTNIIPKVVNLMCGDGQQQQARVSSQQGGAGFYGQSGSSAGQSMSGPASITQSNIPPGTQDMYMLKTQLLPTNPPGSTNPNAPGSTTSNAPGSTTSNAPGSTSANPSPTSSCIKPAPVPPCPPCERCPEPAFDCKRVPNYNSKAINQYIPQPVLADFSQFGM